MTDPPDGGPWLAEFQLPEFDPLMDQPTVLDPAQLALWLSPPDAAVLPLPPAGDSLHLTSSGNSSGTNASGKSLPEEDKVERARALNRAKQARFRARQKERKEQMAAQYEAAAADLEREQALNDTMRQAVAALERVQTQKDIAVQILEAAAGAPPPALKALPQQAASAEQQAAPLEGAMQGAVAPPRALGGALSQLWSLPFQERVQLCTRTFCTTEPVHRSLKDHVGQHAKPDGFALHIDVRKKLAGQLAKHHPQLLDAALQMTPETLLKEWAHLGDLSAEVVALYDGGAIDEQGVEERMCDAVMYFAILGGLLLLHKPDVIQRLLEHTRFPGESDEAATARWAAVADGMGVSREQAVHMVPLFEAYQQRMAALSQATAASMETLREVQESLARQMSQLDVSLQSATMQYLQVFDAAGGLVQHSKAATMVTMDFLTSAGAHVTPLQKARMNALCRPLHPDVVTVVREGLRQFGMLPGQATTGVPAGGAGGATAPSPECCPPAAQQVPQ